MYRWWVNENLLLKRFSDGFDQLIHKLTNTLTVERWKKVGRRKSTLAVVNIGILIGSISKMVGFEQECAITSNAYPIFLYKRHLFKICCLKKGVKLTAILTHIDDKADNSGGYEFRHQLVPNA